MSNRHSKMPDNTLIPLKTLIIVLLLLLTEPCFSQAEKEKISKHLVSIGTNFPISDFSSTHFMGIGIDYSPAHQLGKVSKKQLAFTYNTGGAYYLGKNVTISNNPYQYPGYLFIHAFGGVLYHPSKKIISAIYAGPALGIYNGNTAFNLGSRLEVCYFINKKIAISPAIIMMKKFGTTLLYAASIKAKIVI